MQERKTNKTYFFTVEGETEKLYLDWLQNEINSNSQSKYKVQINSVVEKKPLSFAKKKTRLTVPKINHLADIESKSEEHRKNINSLLNEFKTIKNEKQIECNFGYSNYTFELWIILHKDCFKTPLTDRTKYLSHINRLYGTSFSTLGDYKRADNFKSCLKELDIENVKQAINNAKKLDKHNFEIGNNIISKYNYTYFENDPSTSVHLLIEAILKDCKLI